MRLIASGQARGNRCEHQNTLQALAKDQHADIKNGGTEALPDQEGGHGQSADPESDEEERSQGNSYYTPDASGCQQAWR